MNPHPSDSQWAEIRRLLEWVAAQTNDRGVALGVASRAQDLLPDLFTIRETATSRTRIRPAHQGESATARKKRIRDEARARDRGCVARGITIGGTLIRCLGALQLDHVWGRGKAEETTENVWIMCAKHHDLRQRAVPSRAFWIEYFKAHCQRHEYAEEIAKCDRMLALEEGQHPASAP